MDSSDASWVCACASGHDLGPPPDAVHQPAEVGFRQRERGRIETLGQQQPHRGTARGMEDQGPAVHPLGPALFLVTGPLQPAIHRDDLGHREPLRVHDPFGPRALLLRIDLGHPDAERVVGSSQPLERRIGQQVRPDPRRDRLRGDPPPGQLPSRHAPGEGGQEQRRAAHSRSHPRRRNHR